MTQMVAKLDDLGKPVWIALTVLSFVVFWPIGLALLAFLVSSGRIGPRGGGHCFAGMARHRGRWARPYYSSGNSAFDEYREQALERLEEEQREFQEFLRQLRMAKDRTEFDRFMERRRERALEATEHVDAEELDDDLDAESRTDSPDELTPEERRSSPPRSPDL